MSEAPPPPPMPEVPEPERIEGEDALELIREENPLKRMMKDTDDQERNNKKK